MGHIPGSSIGFNQLLYIGLVILMGTIGGKLARKIHVPQVTGYLLMGLVIGPSGLNILTRDGLAGVRLVNDIALGLILFAIGGVVHLSKFRLIGRKLLFLTLAESAGAFLLVSIATLILGGSLPLAILLGVIAVATAPAATLLVIREYNSRGPVTDYLLAIVALNNLICIILFSLAFAGVHISQGMPLLPALLNPVKEIVGAVVIGGLVGAGLSYWENHIDDLPEMLMAIIGGVLVSTGAAITIGISPLLPAMIAGAVTANFSQMHRLVYIELRQAEQPFYIAFFVLSGAALHIEYLPQLGLLGVAYLIFRVVGKYLGIYLAAKPLGAPQQVRSCVGLALVPQAGVAIGLARATVQAYPEFGMVVQQIILATVIIYESIGPLMTRWAIFHAGEVQKEVKS
ncbi:MAG: cation:proton antiporter [Candidatus Eisenbacteria bacterium]|uniref:Cation:proton antiporter n=1 Tax=Eiseniibacteriota bacterium TaxID=2212470 RepID=A0A948RTX6_UNCEI|nr:cation:proton antiporter [Candidatus Eisenbacteria bacterium]MBU1950517.1 cation:proton antiporter [Candidatus Eisenbacteria bacterium]MBU2690948.1 cation:proton antiporter [Candidatus Eisenbacteria bacterium]